MNYLKHFKRVASLVKGPPQALPSITDFWEEHQFIKLLILKGSKNTTGFEIFDLFDIFDILDIFYIFDINLFPTFIGKDK